MAGRRPAPTRPSLAAFVIDEETLVTFRYKRR